MGLEVATDFISTELVPQSLTFCPHTFPSSEANRPSWQRWSAGQKTDDAKGARTSPASEVSGSETPNTWQDRAQKHYQAKISWKKTKNKTQISWGIALSYWNSEEPQGGWVSAVTVPAEESKWHQLRRNLAGRNLLILCHLHPFSQQCQLSALELFQFSSFCLCCTGLQSFSCRRKPCSHCHSSFPHQKVSLASLLVPFRSTVIYPLELPGLLDLYSGFPLYLWTSTPHGFSASMYFRLPSHSQNYRKQLCTQTKKGLCTISMTQTP